jgi:hypothetical protein
MSESVFSVLKKQLKILLIVEVAGAAVLVSLLLYGLNFPYSQTAGNAAAVVAKLAGVCMLAVPLWLLIDALRRAVAFGLRPLLAYAKKAFLAAFRAVHSAAFQDDLKK